MNVTNYINLKDTKDSINIVSEDKDYLLNYINENEAEQQLKRNKISRSIESCNNVR